MLRACLDESDSRTRAHSTERGQAHTGHLGTCCLDVRESVAGTNFTLTESLPLAKPHHGPDQVRKQHLIAGYPGTGWSQWWAGQQRWTLVAFTNQLWPRRGKQPCWGLSGSHWKPPLSSPPSACCRGSGGPQNPSGAPLKGKSPRAVLSPKGGVTVLGGVSRSCEWRNV